MIGGAPRTEEAKRQFDWPDATIHVPYDSPDIGRIVADLNGTPERLLRLGEIMFGGLHKDTSGCIEFG
jgi:hypothetical protein